MSDYRLDKTAFRILTSEEADRASIFDKATPLSERLRQSYYLTLQAYGYTLQNQPKMDKTVFSMRKFEN
jgi:hypothetical protein